MVVMHRRMFMVEHGGINKTGDATPIRPSSGRRPTGLRAQSGSTGLATRLTTSFTILERQCFTHIITKNKDD